MKKDALGDGAATRIHIYNAKRVFAWLWQAWLEVLKEVPLLRWLTVAAVVLVGLAVYQAAREGKTALEMVVYGMTVLLFALAIPVILYLLFEIYRKHRSDAIFDSKRLADLIHKLAQEDIQLNEETKMVLVNTVYMTPSHKTSTK